VRAYKPRASGNYGGLHMTMIYQTLRLWERFHLY